MIDQKQLLRLIQDTAAGNVDAFETLYQLTAPKLFGLSSRLLKRTDWAEEVLQESFIKIWHHASEYQVERGSVLTWMSTILRYRAIDRIRSIKPTESATELVEEDTLVEQDGPYYLALQRETSDNLQACIEQLSDVQKMSITLAFFEGLTHEELTRRMNKPLGSVKSWIRRGLMSLKRCLSNEL